MPRPTPTTDPGEHLPRFRMSAVARMLGMPVQTLRVWQRRHALVTPARSASGQRLYSAAQVQRLALLRQLTQCGHAIGTLATLSAEALQGVAQAHAQALRQATAPPPPEPATEVPPRRWSDAALADFAGLSSTLACECPKHLAQLLMRLSAFEDYSAQCESLSPEDAALHAYLRQVSAQSRQAFEAALERVALHERLI